MDAKRRFSNYIFVNSRSMLPPPPPVCSRRQLIYLSFRSAQHEVRVPLNTALLAMQNLKAENAFSEEPKHGVEHAALDSSLQMMSQVNPFAFVNSLT